MSETVTVKEVTGPNQNGWYEVELEDGRTATTKNQAIATAATNRRNQPVVVEINESKRGKFTNLYLNAFEDIADEKPARTNGSSGSRSSSTAPRPAGGGKSADVQERIAHQWAYGRAVELLMASGEEFSLPLDAATVSKLESTANTLLEKTR